MTEEENFLIQSAGDNKSYSKDRVIDVLRNYGADKRYEGILEAEDEVGDTKYKFQSLKNDVEERLKELGLPENYATKELYDIMDASNPQEIGEIKAYNSILNLIDKYLEEK